MRFSTPLVLLLAALPRLCLAIPPPIEETIVRDVCILGGGSTGTYAAIRLSQDMGKSVVVIEKTERLGGHTGKCSIALFYFAIIQLRIPTPNLSQCIILCL
jgi:heterodisulfide reductase subunit A-like polyferredoxin